ncbi:MAG: gamma carbonic anhydrase family protein [Alphaproteobacteria bacterium]|nr:gamma carbonic anhydrase family protein [Alphaproteobacteria bacterium]NDE19419.1 gamma carbonic anhydrase family protein [Alphaproteobacteria bacterium]
MPKIIKFKGISPKIDKSSFIAHGAIIAGDVTISENSGVWFNCVLRGDVNPITVGSCTNIQDGTIIHTSRFDGPTSIGNNVTIGHLALIHACTIKNNAFIGMQSTIMDKAMIEEYADRLLALPQFLLNNAEPTLQEKHQAFALTSYFLNRYVIHGIVLKDRQVLIEHSVV